MASPEESRPIESEASSRQDRTTTRLGRFNQRMKERVSRLGLTLRRRVRAQETVQDAQTSVVAISEQDEMASRIPERRAEWFELESPPQSSYMLMRTPQRIVPRQQINSQHTSVSQAHPLVNPRLENARPAIPPLANPPPNRWLTLLPTTRSQVSTTVVVDPLVEQRQTTRNSDDSENQPASEQYDLSSVQTSQPLILMDFVDIPVVDDDVVVEIGLGDVEDQFPAAASEDVLSRTRSVDDASSNAPVPTQAVASGVQSWALGGDAFLEPEERTLDGSPTSPSMQFFSDDLAGIQYSNLEPPISGDRWPDRADSCSETGDDVSVITEGYVERSSDDTYLHNSEGASSHRSLDPSTVNGASVGIGSSVGENPGYSSLDTSEGPSSSRLLNPKKYFDELEMLERGTYERSALKIHMDWKGRQFFKVAEATFSWYDPYSSIDETSLYSRFKLAWESGQESLAVKIWYLFHCYRAMRNIFSNAVKLQREGYCSAYISLLNMESGRRGNCVRLIPLEVSEIGDLGLVFRDTVKKIDNAKEINEMLLTQRTEPLTSLCRVLLSRLDLDVGEATSIRTWVTTVQVLDLAILTYSGAHIEPFDERYLIGQTEFSLPMPLELESFEYEDIQGPPTVICRRRSLECLDAFLRGQQVWVFSLSSMDHGSEGRLHLVTDVDTFADVWGPLWKEHSSKEAKQIVRYRVGHGHIVPWPCQSGLTIEPGEIYCHWVAATEAYDTPEKRFDGSETLVIGAPHVTLALNCSCLNRRIKQHLNEYGLIQPLATSDPSRYVDSETVEVQAGVPAKGFVGKIGRTWKRREGHFQRTALMEAWDHPEMGQLDPAMLEHRYGLEISLSTHNARKARLIRLLGSPSMLEYLRPFPWLNIECRTAYIDAIRSRDHRAFRRLWYNPNLTAGWQENIRKAVCWCLKALSETGVGTKEEQNTLYVIWIPAEGHRHLALLKQPKHKWSGFLKDSKVYFTMAVATDRCLEFPYDGGRLCGTRGHSVFETELIVNESMKPDGLEKRSPREFEGGSECSWSVSQLGRGTFQMGERGAFYSIRRIGPGSLLVKWDGAKIQQAKAKLTNGVFNKPISRHQEYIQDDTELDRMPNGANGTNAVNGARASTHENSRVKPLRVFVTSDSKTP
ncbi:uncharacterized protein PAC_04846 [Phialocephala subalpina]|uniref:Uncharacterized protein n=1 Tax=Phialocephala subalpina TaxID=576137 RepID=A0A1L7WQD1_9HELO|nr:uncharacterized protein PAC_04846 [Phialocephala subalpina]